MSKAITVREATPQDDVRIGEILVEAFVTAYAQKMPEVVVHDERKRELRAVAEKRRHATILVAELDGKIVGTVSIFKPGALGTEAWLADGADLRHLATDVSLHGKGLAGALLSKAEEIVRDVWKAKHVCLHVRRGATGVARMYVSRGYVRDPSGDFDKPGVYLEAHVLHF
ncbi:MAG: GNAT family N-acetyltransferase [Deltaproteobacteria bacterium]|nr:GNAT family N-acetyltransferase [Deltaproteobacteria bacterium]